MKSISKTLIISALMLTATTAANAAPATYKLDDSHTAVTWQVLHMGFSHPTGKFMNIDGALVLDEEKPENSSLNVTIPVAKQESGVPKLDEHMNGPDFFDAAKFPTATFKSTAVEVAADKKTAKVTGDLTLKGVTKPVTLDVTLVGSGEHPMTKARTHGFDATTTIKRSDFGVSYGVPMVSDEVKLTIVSEANKADK